MTATSHDARKAYIAKIAAGLIAQSGFEAATVRRVAAEAGFSTRIVTHYFANKMELLLFVYRQMASEGIKRIEELLSDNPKDLAKNLASFTPTHPDVLLKWRAYFSFWELAQHEPVFAAEQRIWFREAKSRMAAAIRRSFKNHKDADVVAQTLVGLIYGIVLEILIDPESWSPRRAKAVFSDVIRVISGHLEKAEKHVRPK